MGWLADNIMLTEYMEILFDSDDIIKDENGNVFIDIAYRRVSTDKQAEQGFGLDVQRDDIVKYCKDHGIKLCILLTDDGYTGTKMERPAIQHFINMIREFNAGYSIIRINSLIVPRMDRLARSLLSTLQFIQDYIVCQKDAKNSTVNKNNYDIDFISIAEPFCRVDKMNPTSKLMLSLFASLAEFDRDQIVGKLKRGREKRLEEGKWPGGGITPYGYKYDRKSGTLVVIPEQKKKVQELFRLYVEEKMAPGKIAEILGFKGERIVIQILQRKSMLGYVIYNGVEYKGLHEPLISQELFDAAQEEMKLRSIVRTNSYYILSGLVYCGECGSKMRYQKWSKTGECKILCYSQQGSKKYLVKDENCDNLKFWQSDIEDAVIQKLFQMSYLNDESVKKSVSEIDIISNLEKEIEKDRVALSRLYDLYAQGAEDDDILRDKINARKKHKERLEATLIDASKKASIVKRINNSKEALRTIKNTWGNMSRQEKQNICRSLIDRVVLYKNGTVNIRLKLEEYLKENELKI